MTHPGKLPRQRGFTLVELLVAITLLSIMTVLGFQILALLLQLDQNTLADRDARQTRERLAKVFRDDVHQATEAGFAPPTETEPSLSLHRSDGTIVQYTPVERGLERRIPAANEAGYRELELFALPETQFEFSREQSILTLRLTGDLSGVTSHEADVQLSSPDVIEAALGRGKLP